MFIERQFGLKQAVADDLVHRIMPAHVFPQHDEVGFAVKDRRGVKTAGALKRFLVLAHPLRQRKKQFRLHDQFAAGWFEALMDRLDRRLAAQAATGGSEHVPRELGEIHLHIRG